MRRLRLVVVLLFGCIPNLDTSPEANIACVDDSQCPAAFKCRTSLQRCIAQELLDAAAPEIVPGSLVISRFAFTRADVLDVSFDVSEPLASDAAASLRRGENDYPLTLARVDAQHYAFTAQLPDIAPDGTYTLVVHLVGNTGQSAEINASELTFDNLAPRLSDVRLPASLYLRRAAEAELSFTVSETLSEPPLVTLSRDGTVLPWTLSIEDGSGFAFTLRVPADAEAALEGAYAIAVSMRDAAGNETQVSLAEATLDFTPPVLTAVTVAPDSRAARPGQVVVLSVETSEPLLAAPKVTGIGASADLDFLLTSVSGSLISYARALGGLDEGVFTLACDASTDLAGNPLAVEDFGELVVDGTGPVFGGYTASSANLTASDVLTVSFSTNEPLAAPPEVRFGGSLLALQSEGPYVYTLDLATSALVGSFPVTISGSDVLGNFSFVTEDSLTVDSRLPDLVDAFFSPPSARLGTTAILTLTADEPLDPDVPPVLQWSGVNPGFVTPSSAGLNTSYALLINGGVAQGSYTLTGATVVDLAGNSHNVTLSPSRTFSVDSVAPTVSVSTTAPSTGYLKSGATMTVRLTCNDPSATLSASVGAEAMTPGTVHGACDRDFTYTTTVDDSEGTKVVVAQAVDAAGNLGAAQTTINFDFTAPTLQQSSATPTSVRQDVTLSYTVRASEILSTTSLPTVSASRQAPASALVFSLTPSGGAGSQFTFTRAQSVATSEDGTYATTVTLTDLAGNTTTTSGVPFSIDTHISSLDSLTTRDSAGAPEVKLKASKVPGFNAYVVVAEWDIALFDPSETFNVTHEGVGTAPLTCSVDEGTSACVNSDFSNGGGCAQVVCPVLVPGSAVAGQVDRKNIVFTIGDAAGNSASYSTGIVWDTEPPTVVPSSASFQYFLPEQSQLRPFMPNPGGATADSRVRVDFSLTEPARLTAALPDVSVVSVSPQMFAFSRISSAASTSALTFEVRVPSGATSSSSYQLQVVATDSVGNVGTTTFDGTPAQPYFRVDTTLPATPDLLGGSYTRVQRAPYGDGVNPIAFAKVKTTGTYTDPAADGIFVAAYDAPIIPRRLLGFGNLNTDLNLSNDAPRVYLSTVDSSGNESTPVIVRNNEIIYTLRGKSAGNTFTNATEVTATPRFAPTYGQDDGQEMEPSDQQIDGMEGAGVSSYSLSSSGAWTLLSGEGMRPARRSGHGLSADTNRGLIYLFGGTSPSGTPVDNDLWAWNGGQRAWKPVTVVGARPFRRMGGAMTYDVHRDRLVLFGGEMEAVIPPNLSKFVNEVWELNPATGQWLNQTPTGGVQPVARRDASIAYDPLLRRVIIFGGTDSNGTALSDTWGWNGRTATWESKSYSSGPPTVVTLSPSVFDPSQSAIFRFGGLFGASTVNNEGRKWVNALPSWSPSGSPGAAALAGGRHSHAFTYSTHRSAALLFGGKDTANRNDLFELGNWGASCPGGSPCFRPVTTSGSPPSTRTLAASAYDVQRKEMVLFGGATSSCMEDGGGVCSDTWLLNDTTGGWFHWLVNQETPGTATLPGGATGHAMAYDSARKVTVLIKDASTDVYEYSDAHRTWTKYTGSGPTARSNFALAYHAASSSVVMFGGNDGATQQDTWGWGVYGTPTCATATRPCWRNQTAYQATQPEVRSAHVITADAAGNRLLMFGGTAVNAATVYELGNWGAACVTQPCWRAVSAVSTDRPGARNYVAAAFDATNNQLVIFGGNQNTQGVESGVSTSCSPIAAGSTCGDVWRWSAGTWSRVAVPGAADRPSAAAGSAMVWDEDKLRLLYTTGSELWTLSGTSWIRALPSRGDIPAPRTRAAMVWNSGLNGALYYGGMLNTESDELWLYENESKRRPAVIWRAPFALSGHSVSSVSAFNDLSVTVVAGARGYATGSVTPTDGYEVVVWNPSLASWVQVQTGVTNPAGPGAVQSSTVSRSGDAAVKQLFIADQDDVVIAIRPLEDAGNRGAGGSIVVDDVSATIGYQLP